MWFSKIFLYCAQFYSALWSFKANYGFRQIHGAPTVLKIARSWFSHVLWKLYLFVVDYWKSTRLTEILKFYFQLFSPATVYYGIYSNRGVPLTSNARFFGNNIGNSRTRARASSLCLEFCFFCDSWFLSSGDDIFRDLFNREACISVKCFS